MKRLFILSTFLRFLLILIKIEPLYSNYFHLHVVFRPGTVTDPLRLHEATALTMLVLADNTGCVHLFAHGFLNIGSVMIQVTHAHQFVAE